MHAIFEKIHEVFRWMWLDNPIRTTLTLAFLLLIAMFTRRRRRVPSPRHAKTVAHPTAENIPADLRILVNQVEELWTDLGFARQASRAPLEHLSSIPPNKISPQIREVSGKIVESFYRCCFGALEVLPAEIQRLRQELERARSQR